MSACWRESTSIFRLLLKDPKLKVNELDDNGYTPLMQAAGLGYFNIIKWWIASGREMDLQSRLRRLGNADIIGVAKKKGKTEVVTLLERFKKNPVKTRHVMRVELGWYDEVAAERFALVVFSDGLLQIKDTAPTPAARFFNIARRLPLELQMVLCHRVMGSTKEIIAGKESEEAFKELARRLLWS